MRIVSLVPAATDLVAALGLSESLVGVSHECDHPAAQNLPVVTSSAIPAAGIDPDVDPADVDAQVTSTLAAGDALYRTDLELLDSLRPDVVVGQQICDVCAVTADAVVPHLPSGAELVTLTATSIDMLWEDLRSLARALGASDVAEQVIATTVGRLDAVERPQASPSVVTIEWGDPPFVGGHWVPEVVELAGGRHLLGRVGEASRRATWDEIAAAEPDLVVYLPCGYAIDVAAEEGRRTIPRVLQERTWVMDANRLVSRCTPAVADAVEAMAAAFRGDRPDPDDLRPLVP